MRNNIREPAVHPHLTYLLSRSVSPAKSSPNINNQSTTAIPARLWKISARGPLTPKDRKPAVGEPPLIHALSEVVANPRPKTLSIKAHAKIKPITSRRVVRRLFCLFVIYEVNI